MGELLPGLAAWSAWRMIVACSAAGSVEEQVDLRAGAIGRPGALKEGVARSGERRHQLSVSSVVGDGCGYGSLQS
jgi:hypothetical protein